MFIDVGHMQILDYLAKEMLDHLESVLANEPVTVKNGQFIVEVKPQKNEQKTHNPKESTEKSLASTTATFEGIEMVVRNNSSVDKRASKNRGMVLPFQSLSLAFNHVNYYVDMPKVRNILCVACIDTVILNLLLIIRLYACHEMKAQGIEETPGRKTGGYTDESIIISSYPKNQSTFARISGYYEQNDIHSPHVIVYESLIYSTWLCSPRMSKRKLGRTYNPVFLWIEANDPVNFIEKKNFVEEVMELVELNPLWNCLVGLSGVDGLSTKQRKRLTIAVELIANPSIIFMDEPTSGLDARAAVIVMRTLLLMKRGGQVIYAGSLGHHSRLLIEYFQSIPGVPTVKEGYNPTTWMLDITTPAVEGQLNVDFCHLQVAIEIVYIVIQTIIYSVLLTHSKLPDCCHRHDILPQPCSLVSLSLDCKALLPFIRWVRGFGHIDCAVLQKLSDGVVDAPTGNSGSDYSEKNGILCSFSVMGKRDLELEL
ncbi:hypothetical protein H5410_003685 [Solanum commersonii]|uniref:ABC transporter domain-containing protein n=1 Tax=Solanum commersonii TaxID=4109 RepID=A0A9J6B5P7_SOLCO|nr:hypothetical protein H5410_003685 [Solanum commersonii]